LPVCSTGKEGQAVPSNGQLDQLSAAEAGSNPEEPSHHDFYQQQTPTSLFDDDEDLLDDEQGESEQGSPFVVGSECSSADMDGDQLSAFLQQHQQQLSSQESLDALLLCSGLFSANNNSVSNSMYDGLSSGQHLAATADAELFDSFLDLDWSTIEQSAGAAAAASGLIFYPTALLESSV
jgi:hypothetical protein